MTNDNKQQKPSDSTDPAIAYSTCYKPFFERGDFYNEAIEDEKTKIYKKSQLIAYSVIPSDPIGQYIEINDVKIYRKLFPEEFDIICKQYNSIINKAKNFTNHKIELIKELQKDFKPPRI